MFCVGAVALFIKLMHDIMQTDLLSQVPYALPHHSGGLITLTHNVTQFLVTGMQHDKTVKIVSL